MHFWAFLSLFASCRGFKLVVLSHFAGKDAFAIYACLLTFSLVVVLFLRLLWRVGTDLSFRASARVRHAFRTKAGCVPPRFVERNGLVLSVGLTLWAVLLSD